MASITNGFGREQLAQPPTSEVFMLNGNDANPKSPASTNNHHALSGSGSEITEIQPPSGGHTPTQHGQVPHHADSQVQGDESRRTRQSFGPSTHPELIRHYNSLTQVIAAAQANNNFELVEVQHLASNTAAALEEHKSICSETLAKMQGQISGLADQLAGLGDNIKSNEEVDCSTDEDGSKHDVRPKISESRANHKNKDISIATAATKASSEPRRRVIASNPEEGHGAATSISPRKWQPYYLRGLPSADVAVQVHDNRETFSLNHLQKVFESEQWSPGFYLASKNSVRSARAYWALDATVEPFAPVKPGEHGAKMTPFFNETESEMAPSLSDYENVPVFVDLRGTDEFQYMGQYTSNRFSDRVGFDVLMEHVPVTVQRFWASELASNDRPQWVTKKIMDHFWPMPQYSGPMPTDSAVNTPGTFAGSSNSESSPNHPEVLSALNAYAEELKGWETEAKMKVSMLTEGTLFDAFKAADADGEPGLRLWWEYLVCVGYDEELYKALAASKQVEAIQDAKSEGVPSDHSEKKPEKKAVNDTSEKLQEERTAMQQREQTTEDMELLREQGKDRLQEVAAELAKMRTAAALASKSEDNDKHSTPPQSAENAVNDNKTEREHEHEPKIKLLPPHLRKKANEVTFPQQQIEVDMCAGRLRYEGDLEEAKLFSKMARKASSRKNKASSNKR